MSSSYSVRCCSQATSPARARAERSRSSARSSTAASSRQAVGGRGDRAEHLTLVSQHGQIRDGLAAISQQSCPGMPDRPRTVVGGPGARDVQFPIHSGVSALAGVDQVGGDLGVLDPARFAGVLTLDADHGGALLHITGLIDHQDRLVVVQMLDDVVARRRGPGPYPTLPAPAGAACRPVSSRRPIQRWSSSSCAAGPTAARVPGSGSGAGVRHARTGPRCAPSGPRTSPASGQALRCDLRPPRDPLCSHAGDQRWPHPRADRSRPAIPSAVRPAGSSRTPPVIPA